MLGFVGLLSSALAAVVNVFVVMLLSFLQAQMAPQEGVYKLATENGLVFPIETHILTDDAFETMVGTYKKIYQEQRMYATTSCVLGDYLDTLAAKRFSTYNFVYLNRQKKMRQDMALVEAIPVEKRDSKLKDMCYLTLKPKSLYEKTIDAPSDIGEEEVLR